jgi:hypothetical protein
MANSYSELIINAPSAIRGILSLFLIYLPSQNKWGWALFIFIIASLTDALDGYLSVRLGIKTRYGRLVDEFFDVIMIICAVGGLWLAGIITPRELWLFGLTFCFIYPFQVLPKKHPLRIFSNGATVIYFFIMIFVLIVVYAFKGFGIYAWWFIPPSVIIFWIIIYFKRYRLEQFLRGEI